MTSELPHSASRSLTKLVFTAFCNMTLEVLDGASASSVTSRSEHIPSLPQTGKQPLSQESWLFFLGNGPCQSQPRSEENSLLLGQALGALPVARTQMSLKIITCLLLLWAIKLRTSGFSVTSLSLCQSSLPPANRIICLPYNTSRNLGITAPIHHQQQLKNSQKCSLYLGIMIHTTDA